MRYIINSTSFFELMKKWSRSVSIFEREKREDYNECLVNMKELLIKVLANELKQQRYDQETFFFAVYHFEFAPDIGPLYSEEEAPDNSECPKE